MKILQLTHKPPVPSIDGGCLAMNQITNCLLRASAEVKVVSIATIKHPIVSSEEFQLYKEKTNFESVFIDTRVKCFKAISSFIKGNSLQADRFFAEEMAKKLKDIFLKEKFDVVILESVFVGHYIEIIRKYSDAKIILRVHNIEYLIWKRLSKQTHNPVKKAANRYLSSSLNRFELSLFKKIDGYMPITEVDHRFFQAKFPNVSSKVIPFCVDLSAYHYCEQTIKENELSFFHIGSMNWQPNIEGMNWFLETVWEKIANRYPQLSLVIAGKGNKAVFANKKYMNVKIFDYVENAQQFMNEHGIMVVPLLSGSGMRIKIMEGMALGKTIITTTVGAEGIEITHKENIFLADTTEEMIQTIVFCVNNVEKCKEVGKNARKLIEKRYTEEVITKNLEEFLEKNRILGTCNK